MTKFNLGDTIFFMRLNRVVSEPVIGVIHINVDMGHEQSFIQHSPEWLKPDEVDMDRIPTTVYVTGLCYVDEKFAFASFNDIIEYLRLYNDVENGNTV